jgi:hypothetical protein
VNTKKTVVLDQATDDELIELFREVTEQQYYADQMDRTREYTKLYRDMEHIERELKRRPGDQRRLLARLFEDRNPQVRIMAAGAALAVVPAEARTILEALEQSGEYPQTAEARGLLMAMDEGRYKPE